MGHSAGLGAAPAGDGTLGSSTNREGLSAAPSLRWESWSFKLKEMPAKTSIFKAVWFPRECLCNYVFSSTEHDRFAFQQKELAFKTTKKGVPGAPVPLPNHARCPCEADAQRWGGLPLGRRGQASDEEPQGLQRLTGHASVPDIPRCPPKRAAIQPGGDSVLSHAGPSAEPRPGSPASGHREQTAFLARSLPRTQGLQNRLAWLGADSQSTSGEQVLNGEEVNPGHLLLSGGPVGKDPAIAPTPSPHRQERKRQERPRAHAREASSF